MGVFISIFIGVCPIDGVFPLVANAPEGQLLQGVAAAAHANSRCGRGLVCFQCTWKKGSVLREVKSAKPSVAAFAHCVQALCNCRAQPHPGLVCLHLDFLVLSFVLAGALLTPGSLLLQSLRNVEVVSRMTMSTFLLLMWSCPTTTLSLVVWFWVLGVLPLALFVAALVVDSGSGMLALLVFLVMFFAL